MIVGEFDTEARIVSERLPAPRASSGVAATPRVELNQADWCRPLVPSERR